MPRTPPATPPKMSELALVLVVAALLGANFTFTKVAVPEFGAIPLNAARLLVAAGVLALAAVAVRGRLTFPGRWRDWFVFGALHAAVPFSLAAWAQLSIPASLAAVLMATVPMFSAVFSAGWLRERLTGRVLVGLATGLLGVAVLSGADAFTGGSAAGVLAMVAGTASYALGAVYAKRRLADADAVSLTVGNCGTAGLLLLPGAIVAAPAQAPSLAAFAALAGLTLLGTVVAYGLYFQLLSRSSAVVATSTTYLVPAFGALLGVVLLHERFTPAMLAGVLLIIASLAFVTGVRRPPSARPAAALARPTGTR